MWCPFMGEDEIDSAYSDRFTYHSRQPNNSVGYNVSLSLPGMIKAMPRSLWVLVLDTAFTCSALNVIWTSITRCVTFSYFCRGSWIKFIQISMITWPCTYFVPFLNKDGVELTFFKFALLQDFITALQQVRPSVSQSELGFYEDWNRQFGSLAL